jgi:hypothetical protein
LDDRTSLDPLDLPLGDTKRVLDVTRGRFARTVPGWPPDLAIDERSPGELREELGERRLGPNDLLALAVGPDQAQPGDGMEQLAALDSLGPGTRFALLVSGGRDAPPDSLLADRLAAHDARIHEILPAGRGTVIALGVRLGPGDDAAADGPTVDADPVRHGLRLVNEARLSLRPSDDAEESSSAGTPADTAARFEIRRLNRRVRELQEEVSRLESSTSYRLGNSLVRAARSPRRSLRLASEMVQLWRARSDYRGRIKPAGPRSRVDSLSAWYEAIRVSPERLLLAHSSGPAGARTRLVLAAITTDATAQLLSADAVIHRLGPNDALLALERADPDVVLVETAAFGAGHSWAYAGHPAATERDLRLLEVVDAARAMGRPTVLWWTATRPDPVGLGHFAGRFDLMLAADPDRELPFWSVGVQLSRFNDIGLDPRRAGPPLLLGGWDPRAPYETRLGFQKLLEAAVPLGLEVRVDAHALDEALQFPDSVRARLGEPSDLLASAGLMRSHPLLIVPPTATGTDTALRAIACGARVVTIPIPGLGEAGGQALSVVADPSTAEAALGDAIAAGPRADEDVRVELRRLFAEHAVAVRLAALTDRLGSRIDPLADRRVTIVAALGGPAEAKAQRVVEDLLGQVLRPTEVILVPASGDPVPAGAIDRLAEASIRAVVVDPRSADASWAAIAQGAGSAWLAPWSTDRGHPPHHLLDLLLAAEMSGADAVGFVAGRGSRYVDDLRIGTAILRTERAADALAGVPFTELDASLAAAGQRGLRLFGLPALDEATAR